MARMAQSTLDRIWNRLVNRYDQNVSSCCGREIEEAQPDSAEDESGSCCG